MLNHLSTLTAGFSIFACVILLLAYLLFLPGMSKSTGAKIWCFLLLCALAVLQWLHSLFFTIGIDLLALRSYGLLLMVIPPLFYLFSRSILSATPGVSEHTKLDLLHAIGPLAALALPTSLLTPLAFMFGTGYTFWFALRIAKLRGHTDRFKFELFFFAMFAVMALGALMLGLSLPYIDHAIFYTAYSNSVAVALMLIIAALLFFPELLSDILIVSQLSYAKSRLHGIDTDLKLKELDKFMVLEKHYQNEELSLNSLADLVDLTSHQLSELINSHFGYGFPRYVREQRVNAAKRLLLKDAKTSILAISMETGFKSQSNFYTAFKEITGMSPGKYRKTSQL